MPRKGGAEDPNPGWTTGKDPVCPRFSEADAAIGARRRTGDALIGQPVDAIEAPGLRSAVGLRGAHAIAHRSIFELRQTAGSRSSAPTQPSQEHFYHGYQLHSHQHPLRSEA